MRFSPLVCAAGCPTPLRGDPPRALDETEGRSHLLALDDVGAGDAVLVSGTVGDHGTAIMLARGDLDIEAELESDTASLLSLCRAMLAAGAAEILGIDPLYMANEGKIVAVVAEADAAAMLAAMRAHPLGAQAAVIGEMRQEPSGMVFMHTAFEGSCVVDMLIGDPLPRIC